MTTKIHLRTPVKIYANGWLDAELVITEASLIIGKQNILLEGIEDLEDIDMDGIRCIHIKENSKIIIQLPEKVRQQVFKFIAFNLREVKFAVNFLSPATVGGVLSTMTRWEKGYFSMTDYGFWYLTAKYQIRIQSENLVFINKCMINFKGEQKMVLVLSHIEKNNVVTSLVQCPENTLEMLEKHLKRHLKKHQTAFSLSADEEQILILVYSGLNSALVEKVIGISTDELGYFYDRLVISGLAKVVKIRKEIELTSQGVRMAAGIISDNF